MHFEPLESRQLMSVSLLGNVLSVYGTPYGDWLTVSQSGTTLTVWETASFWKILTGAIPSLFASTATKYLRCQCRSSFFFHDTPHGHLAPLCMEL